MFSEKGKTLEIKRKETHIWGEILQRINNNFIYIFLLEDSIFYQNGHHPI